MIPEERAKRVLERELSVRRYDNGRNAPKAHDLLHREPLVIKFDIL